MASAIGVATHKNNPLLGYSLAFSPRVTRWIGGIFAIETVSDFLHIAYDRAKKEL
jgi:hypothetical protein